MRNNEKHMKQRNTIMRENNVTKTHEPFGKHMQQQRERKPWNKTREKKRERNPWNNNMKRKQNMGNACRHHEQIVKKKKH